VSQLLPQLQVTVMVLYWGWIFGFMRPPPMVSEKGAHYPQFGRRWQGRLYSGWRIADG
jgi:hypothetical protein